VVLRGHLTLLQTLIMLESMPSTRSSPAIRSRGVDGWVSANISDSTCWVEVTAVFLMTRQVARSMGSTAIEPKQKSTGSMSKSKRLQGRRRRLVKPPSCTKNLRSNPYLARQVSEV
jgi:hypothetical protein